MYTLGAAARATGKSKATISRAIKAGRLSAARGGDGDYSIDPAELHRVYPVTGAGNGSAERDATPDATEAHPSPETVALNRLAEEQATTIRDLRHRLDTATETLNRLTAALTVQRSTPPRRSWWRWRRLALIVVLLAGGPGLCFAAEDGRKRLSGNDLLFTCEQVDPMLGGVFCAGYVEGVMDSYAPGVLCPPEGITRAQAKDEVVRYLEAHSEIRHTPASVLTQKALAGAFPCER